VLPSAGSVGRFRPWRALGSQVADPVRDLELLLLPLLLVPEAPPPLESLGTSGAVNTDTIRYDTRCCFKVRSKADTSHVNLPHGTDN